MNNRSSKLPVVCAAVVMGIATAWAIQKITNPANALSAVMQPEGDFSPPAASEDVETTSSAFHNPFQPPNGLNNDAQTSLLPNSRVVFALSFPKGEAFERMRTMGFRFVKVALGDTRLSTAENVYVHASEIKSLQGDPRFEALMSRDGGFNLVVEDQP